MSEDEIQKLKARESRLAFSEKVDSFIGAAIGATAAVAAPAQFSVWAFLAAAIIAGLLLMHFGKTELGQIRRRIQELESGSAAEPKG